MLICQNAIFARCEGAKYAHGNVLARSVEAFHQFEDAWRARWTVERMYYERRRFRG